ncbi:hypothetical protein AUI46_05515 [archaeon 13_1_40CM_2_52_13]|nr:MAG: hypothetical protein AUI46_05515 [archaeon 13_1_40CM_2_52_13]TMI39906.1 MAG: hypothetical protein E6H21_08005 [Candidatus Bathyarchaeota archaeon]
MKAGESSVKGNKGSLRVSRKSPGKRLRVRVDDKIGVTLEKMRTGFLLGPCDDPASNRASRKISYAC